MCRHPSYHTYHVVHSRSCNRQHGTDCVGSLAHLWSQQSDAGSTYAYDTHTLFLAT